MEPTIKQLITGLPVEIYKGGKDVSITGLCSHSKLVAPGDLFIAKKGTIDDGSKYIEEAILSGASAILTDFPNPFLKDVTQLITPDVRVIEAEISARFYGNPSHSLFMVGVTGTNGKTTISYLVKHIFDSFQISCGLIGTIEYIIGEHHFAASLTTPDVITNQKLLKEMVKNKCEAAVMETTSIGLEQGRLAKLKFDVAIFSNLSQDHLDYHKTMEAYAQSKAKLFNELDENGCAIINADCKWSTYMQQKSRGRILTYGFKKDADLYAHTVEFKPDQTSFLLTYQGKTLPFSWKLIGRFNLYNCLAAIGAALCKKIPFEAMPSIISRFSPIPGRLEWIENLSGLHIYVDYAHTPDALENTLSTLHELKQGKIFTVFGCGGNRDRFKRPQMAAAAEKYSDFTVVTSDNPRKEDPYTICEEVAQGFKQTRYMIEIDRRAAIERAIEMAQLGDLILIAGKGHETYQIFAHQTIPFDDRQIAQEIANRVRFS